jgi:uncharacterized protein YndB with AHSA1/START domain
MIKILGYVVLTLLAAVVLLVAYASTRPDSFRIERRLRIAATPDQLYPLIADLHGFNRWNPWAQKDPKMTSEYTGPAGAQIGSKYAWQSGEVGEGSMTVTALEPARRVSYRLEFIKPFAAINQADFTLTPALEGGTDVLWAMEGPSPLVSKVMGVIFNIDRMVGADFEAGLNGLKKIAEARP